MLTSRGSGKYLYGRWHTDRDKAMRGVGGSGEFSQAELELSDVDVDGQHYKESYELDTAPIEPHIEPKIRDIRDKPQRGGME